MTIEAILEQQASVLRLLDAANVEPGERAGYEIILTKPKVLSFISSESNLEVVQQKLAGKRVSITERQQEIVTLVKHLHHFEQTMGSWLETQPTRPYAAEFILAHYNIEQKEFVEEGTHALLTQKVHFNGIQTLRRFSQFSDALATMYGEMHERTVDYTARAHEVAQMLVGRTLVCPRVPLENAHAINLWRAYLAGNKEDYTPIRARIIETESFETDQEVTKSRYCMLAAPGQIDMMPNRGHSLFNIGTQAIHIPSCVMIRAVITEGTILEGPGKVSEALSAQHFVGHFLGLDIPIEGRTNPSGYMPGSASFSTGRYRMQ